MESHKVFAGKIVSKKIITKSNQKEKMTQEIAIHRSLAHKHVVGFHGFFEDNFNVYIVLELCRRRVCNYLDPTWQTMPSQPRAYATR